MAYNLTTLKTTLQSLLPDNSRLRISTHRNVNDQLLDYLYIPFGIAFPCLSSTVPANCHKCDGALLNRVDYPYLFDAIGTLYGVGNGTTTFSLPLIPAGASIVQAGTDSVTNKVFTLGVAGDGEVKHTLTIPEIPSHNHYSFSEPVISKSAGTGNGTVDPMTGSGSNNPSTSSTGGGESHNNMPPYVVGNWIMRLK